MHPDGNEIHPMILHCKRVLEENPNISNLGLAKRLHLQSIGTVIFWRWQTERYLRSLLPDETTEDIYIFDGDESSVVEQGERESVIEVQKTKPWWKFW